MLVSGMSLFEMRYLMDNFPQDFANHKVYDGSSCASVGTRYTATVKLPRGREATVTSVNRYIISIEGTGDRDKNDTEVEAVEQAPEWHRVCHPENIKSHGTHITEALKDIKVAGYQPMDELTGPRLAFVMCSLLPYECAGVATKQRIKIRHSGDYGCEEGIIIHEIEPYNAVQ
ncbi:hypothetical protein VPHD528_0104 [Vibrio phage D528]